MDALADLLDGVRARGALFSRSIMTPPWSVRFTRTAPLTLYTMVRGQGWIIPAHGAPVELATGDIAVARGPGPHTVADQPDTPPTCLVDAADTCTDPDGRPLDDAALGPRTYGAATDAPDQLLSATYEVSAEVSRRLFSALPGLLVVPADECRGTFIDLITQETACEVPGQQVVLDRLLDLVLVTVLRTWFDRPGAHAPAWYTAMADPVVGRALRLLHDDPAHHWTVAALADKCGVSRASLARRFTALVGEPPMAYLTDWRITLAADMLRDPDTTVGAVAHRVGYSTTFALSVAFKRLRGQTPTDYRRTSSAT